MSETKYKNSSQKTYLLKDELEAEIRTLKTKKASGPDGVTNDMILHLGPSAKKAILAHLTNPGSQAPFQFLGKGLNNSFLQETSQQPFKLPRKATGTYHKYKTV